MSSSNTLDNNKMTINDGNNNLIKQFSRNFAKNLQTLKLSYVSNKNDSESSVKRIKKKENSESTKVSNKTILNSVFDYIFLNMTPEEEKKNSSKKQTITNHNPKQISIKINSGKKNSSKSKNNPFSSSFKADQTTTLQSSQILNDKKKKALNIKSRLIVKSKSQNRNIIFAKKKPDPFIERMNRYQSERKLSINNLRIKLMEKEALEYSNQPKISKTSLLLIKKKYDKNALYQPRQMKEKNIQKNFNDFYDKTLKESHSCFSFGKSNKFSLEKFNKFYEKKMEWKKGIEDKIRNDKNLSKQEEEKDISKLTFKPSLNEKSLKMINKKVTKDEKDIYLNKNEKEIKRIEDMNKYKLKIKNIINNFNDKCPNFRTNKNKDIISRSKTQVNISTRYNIWKKNNINKIKSKNRLYKLKNKNQRKEMNKKDINDDFKSINKYTYILKKKQKMQQKKFKNMNEFDIYSFYKINVNSGCAWMNETINQINYSKRYKKIITGLIS